eukprot:CAMPEP_0119186020 /NCGR_PEP_ID=MMETSP1315-20130426/68807_1 /TAXON_ID=676789 /ORGANISM="Prasinoderma singularis, Strain RCC927" /LENGTH=282 /DNA_ID=CAMNT_0007180453 /DNA_START=510 /DNA_END=1358 /DNA_ORIENTATION=+
MASLAVRPAAPPRAAPPRCSRVATRAKAYTVLSGDSLSKIADSNKVDIADIEAANPQLAARAAKGQVAGTVIFPGEQLEVPGNGLGFGIAGGAKPVAGLALALGAVAALLFANARSPPGPPGNVNARDALRFATPTLPKVLPKMPLSMPGGRAAAETRAKEAQEYAAARNAAARAARKAASVKVTAEIEAEAAAEMKARAKTQMAGTDVAAEALAVQDAVEASSASAAPTAAKKATPTPSPEVLGLSPLPSLSEEALKPLKPAQAAGVLAGLAALAGLAVRQ